MTKIKVFWGNLFASHRSNGFTLVELVITMGLMGILLLGAVTIFMAGNKTFVSTQVRNRQQLLLDGMVEIISTELRYATEVELNGTNGDRIYGDGENLYVTALSGAEPTLLGDGYDLTLEFRRVDGYTLSLEVALADEPSGVTTRESTAIRLINCEIKSNPLEDAPDTGAAVAYFGDAVS